MQGATKVGALLIAFMVLLWSAYYLVGESMFAKKTKTYYADFEDAGGILAGTQVLMAGVPIGSVKQVVLRTPRIARMTLAVDESVSVPKGSIALLPSALLSLSSSPVSIVPPTLAADELPSGSVILGSRPNPLEAMLPGTKDTMKELTLTLHATRKLLEDDKLMAQMQTLMKTSNDAIGKFGALADQTQTLLGRNHKEIDSAIHSAALAMRDVQVSTEMIAKLMKEGKLQGESVALLHSLNATTAKAGTLVADLDKFISDPKLRQPLNTTMGNVADITGTGKKIATNTEEMTANGVVVSKKAIELADKAGQLADEAKEVMKKLGGFFSKPGSKAPPIKLSMDLTRQSKPGYWRTDVTAQVPMFDSNFDLGLYDAFEGNKITAQLNKQFSTMGDYRYGVYASKPGVGVDYRLTPKLGIRGDLFDINNSQFNLRAQYELRDGVYGWVGVDRIFRQNAPSIGFGVHK